MKPLLDLSAPPLETVDSTQRVLLELALAGAPEGTVVRAREMTGGRGRGQHRWEAARDRGLWMSFLLRPRLEMAAWPALMPLLALGVAESIEQLACRAGVAHDILIKWPNDVLGRAGKLSGILAETSGRAVLCGVGINLDHRPTDFPADLRDAASSLWIEGIRDPSGGGVSAGAMAEILNERLTASYDRFQNGDRDFLRDGLRARAALAGAFVTVDDGAHRHQGRVVDVGPLGQLVIVPDGAGEPDADSGADRPGRGPGPEPREASGGSGGGRRLIHSGTIIDVRF